MSSQRGQSGRVLYVITCATPAARDIGTLVSLAQASGWTVCVIATPSALRFIDKPSLEAQTGYPVRSEYKQPGTPDVLPPADAMVVGGASFNTINKWAAGISDTLAVGLLAEAIGLGPPLAALPFLNADQTEHPVTRPPGAHQLRSRHGHYRSRAGTYPMWLTRMMTSWGLSISVGPTAYTV
ncbi:MAG: flavoprotein [Pseudonocardiaceae bacterium]